MGTGCVDPGVIVLLLLPRHVMKDPAPISPSDCKVKACRRHCRHNTINTSNCYSVSHLDRCLLSIHPTTHSPHSAGASDNLLTASLRWLIQLTPITIETSCQRLNPTYLHQRISIWALGTGHLRAIRARLQRNHRCQPLLVQQVCSTRLKGARSYKNIQICRHKYRYLPTSILLLHRMDGVRTSQFHRHRMRRALSMAANSSNLAPAHPPRTTRRRLMVNIRTEHRGL